MEHLIRSNIHFLVQAERLLTKLADGEYTCCVKTFYGSTLGQHLRHCLDHYRSFLSGLENGRVDYDHRTRDLALESSTDAAISEVRSIIHDLEHFLVSEPPVGILVKMDCGGSEQEWQPSTTGRELQFLVSHTVHHFAMIGGMCSCLDIAMEDGFGVAPSTLRHREMATID